MEQYCEEISLEDYLLSGISRLLSRVLVDSSETFLDKDLGERLLADVKFADKTSDLIDVVDINFYVSLVQALRCQVMCLLTKRFALVGWVACRFRCFDTTKNKVELYEMSVAPSRSHLNR
jgi:hypothetical protein